MYVCMLNNTVHGPNKHNITSKCVHIIYLFRDYHKHTYNAKTQIYTIVYGTLIKEKKKFEKKSSQMDLHLGPFLW